MTLAIMQPYFLPYIGYWQLLAAVDKFVVYDNIQFTKRGWIHRNRLLQNGKDEYFSLPLKKDSDYLNVVERFLSAEADNELMKILRRIENNYRKAPEFSNVFPLFEQILTNPERNLFAFIYQSIQQLAETLEIETEIVVSSTIDIPHELKAQDKVLALCKALKADQYLNAIGGQELYDPQTFDGEGIKLQFIKSGLSPYNQFNNEFIPGLSILDLLMFLPKEAVKKMISQDFQLID